MDFLSDFRGREAATAPGLEASRTRAATRSQTVEVESDLRAAARLPHPTPPPGPSPAPARSGRARPTGAPPDLRRFIRGVRWAGRPSGRGDRSRQGPARLASLSGAGRWLDDLVENYDENPQATAAMFLGVASIFLPVLAVASVVMAVACLRRLAQQPWRGGRGRAIAGIVASVVLAPVSVAVWASLL